MTKVEGTKGYIGRSLVLFRLLTHCLHKFKSAFCKLSLYAFGIGINCLLNEHKYYPRVFLDKSSGMIDDNNDNNDNDNDDEDGNRNKEKRSSELDLLPPINKRARLSKAAKQEELRLKRFDKNRQDGGKSGNGEKIDKYSMEKREWFISRGNYILETMTLTMECGQKEELIDKQMYLTILSLLIQQLKKGVILRDYNDNNLQYISYFEKYVTPCIVALADNTKEHNLWRELNHKVLLLSKNHNCLIRLACADALLGLYTHMKNAWLNQLTETLNFIDELLQDSNEQVEERTRLVVRKIEHLTGETLQRLLS